MRGDCCCGSHGCRLVRSGVVDDGERGVRVWWQLARHCCGCHARRSGGFSYSARVSCRGGRVDDGATDAVAGAQSGVDATGVTLEHDHTEEAVEGGGLIRNGMIAT
jgi:hypothetical protein